MLYPCPICHAVLVSMLTSLSAASFSFFGTHVVSARDVLYLVCSLASVTSTSAFALETGCAASALYKDDVALKSKVSLDFILSSQQFILFLVISV
mmetsp:Transcript_47866/g.126982  ORF Transcript_47866/g.126982 Transcript_47866/m.126982 type:complete len:95 (-) Transcript_47866:1081-1365(-)